MGLLSALTTGWWGHFGERHGRTKVLAIATLGLFLVCVSSSKCLEVYLHPYHSDLTFIVVSMPSSPLSSYGHELLLVAPFIDGLLGGWVTLHSATSAYISDCTSSGSRASVFSRFTGVSFLGFSVGPIIGGMILRHPFAFLPDAGQGQGQSVTSVFLVAALGSFINFCLVLFVFPESVSREKRDLASGRGKGKGPSLTFEGAAAAGQVTEPPAEVGILARVGFLRHLAFFLPVPVYIEGSTRKRKDWSLTLLACALFGYFLSAVSTYTSQTPIN